MYGVSVVITVSPYSAWILTATVKHKKMSLLKIKKFKELKQLSSTRDDRSDLILQQCINEAEEADISEMLGNALYTAVIQAPSAFADLLEPAVYSYGGKTFSHSGLYKVIAGYAYARFLEGENVRVTPSGITRFAMENTELVSMSEIHLRAVASRATADILYQRIRDYISHTEKYAGYVEAAEPVGETLAV